MTHFLLLTVGITTPETAQVVVDMMYASAMRSEAPTLFKTIEQPINEYLHSEETFDISVDEVRITHYYTNDATGSGKCTASGKCVNEFDINENGWYTYQGMVVIAAATYRCLFSRSGACGRLSSVPSGYNLHDLYETLMIQVNGIMVDAIILDSCGSCMKKVGNETLQRYDIFTVNPRHTLFEKPQSYGKVLQFTPQSN